MRNAPKPQIETEQLVQMYQSGRSLESIARTVPMTASGIRHRLISAGVVMRPKNIGIAPSNKHPIQTSELIARYRSGVAAHVIGREVGLSAKAVLDRLRRAGEKRRTRSDYAGPVHSANPNWRGGRFITDHGYVRIRQNGGYVFEHRAVAEQTLGRPLSTTEHVHHLNGIRDDNRPENLVALDASTHKREGWTLVKALQARIRELETLIQKSS